MGIMSWLLYSPCRPMEPESGFNSRCHSLNTAGPATGIVGSSFQSLQKEKISADGAA